MASADVQQFLETHKPHFKLLENGKVQCELNGHSFPPNIQALSTFANGLKFQRLKRNQEVSKLLTDYDPFIVQSKNFPNMLYCALTGQLLEMSLDAVKRHLKGKRFTKARGMFDDDKLELRPEPDVGQIVKNFEEEPEAMEGAEEEFWAPDQKAEPSTVQRDDDAMEGSTDELKGGKKLNGTGTEDGLKAQTKIASSNDISSTAKLKKRKKVKPSAPKKQRV